MNEELNQTVESTLANTMTGMTNTNMTDSHAVGNSNPVVQQMMNTARAALRNNSRGMLGYNGTNSQSNGIEGFYNRFLNESNNPGNINGIASSQQLSGQPAFGMQGNLPSVRSQSNGLQTASVVPQSSPIGGIASQAAGVYMRRISGQDVYSYANAEGVRFDLPKGININDDNAVNSAIVSNQDMYNLMNEVYNDEEV